MQLKKSTNAWLKSSRFGIFLCMCFLLRNSITIDAFRIALKQPKIIWIDWNRFERSLFVFTSSRGQEIKEPEDILLKLWQIAKLHLHFHQCYTCLYLIYFLYFVPSELFRIMMKVLEGAPHYLIVICDLFSYLLKFTCFLSSLRPSLHLQFM